MKMSEKEEHEWIMKQLKKWHDRGADREVSFADWLRKQEAQNESG